MVVARRAAEKGCSADVSRNVRKRL